MRKRKHGSQAGHVRGRRRTSLLVYSVLTGNPHSVRMYGYVCTCTYGMYSASRPWEKKRKKKKVKKDCDAFFFFFFFSLYSIHTYIWRSIDIFFARTTFLDFLRCAAFCLLSQLYLNSTLENSFFVCVCECFFFFLKEIKKESFFLFQPFLIYIHTLLVFLKARNLLQTKKKKNKKKKKQNNEISILLTLIFYYGGSALFFGLIYWHRTWRR